MTNERNRNGGSWGLVLGLVLLVLVFALTLLRYAPPAPAAADAPAGEFSAARAMELLRGLVGDGEPRPVGSEGNARARGWLVEQLTAMGYTPQVQEAVACSRYGSCGRVANVLARLEGTGGSGALLLMAHYDSVPAGPGAADDGAGVATVLEIARILKQGTQPKNTVIFLLDDGEESGLLGAEAFAGQHPWADEVRMVVNVEARGSSGASLMFETSPGNAWTLPFFARGVERPVTSSVFYTIYQALPNDTDFTVFKRRGVPGFNFAFVGGPLDYHKPTDNLEQLSTATVQHQGDNALGLARTLAAADLSGAPSGNAVFFDVFAWTTLWWSEGLNLVLAVVALVLVVVSLVVLGRRRQLTGGGVLLGLLTWLVSVVLGLALAWVLGFVLRALGAIPSPWVSFWTASPGALQAALWFAALVAALVAANLLGRRAGSWGTWAGVWLWWAVLGLALAVEVPGTSFLFVVPALVAGVFGLLAAWTGSALLGRLAVLLPAVAAASLFFFLALMIYLGLGSVTAGILAVAILVTLVAGTLMPLAAEAARRWLVTAVAAAAMVVAAILAVAAPRFTADDPRFVNVTYFEDGDSGEAHLVVPVWQRMPAPMRQAAEFAPEPQWPFPWGDGRPVFSIAPVAAAALPPPQVEVLEREEASGGGYRVRARVRSPRGAPKVRFYVPREAAPSAVSLAGTDVPLPEGSSAAGWLTFTFQGLGEEGVELTGSFAAEDTPEIYVVDESYGLPPEGRDLAAARPENVATIQSGDNTLVSHRARLEAPAAPGDGEAEEGEQTEAGEGEVPAGST